MTCGAELDHSVCILGALSSSNWHVSLINMTSSAEAIPDIILFLSSVALSPLALAFLESFGLGFS